MDMIEFESEDQIQIHCMLCNEPITDANFISLSNENGKEAHRELIESIISQILEQHTDGTVLHSDTLCGSCFTSFKQVHDMENTLQVQKKQLMNRLKSMGTAAITVTENETEEYIGPKKILDIPSSDDESENNQLMNGTLMPHQEKKLKTIEEIEEELVKIHGPADDMNLVAIHNNTQDNQAKLNENLVQTLEPHQFIKIEAIEQDDKSKILQRAIDILKTEQGIDAKLNNQKTLKDELSADEMVARQDNLYTCMLCEGDETVCGEARAIATHIREAHDQRIYICDVCGDYFRKRTELSSHMDDHIENDDGDFQCEICNRIFNNLRLFRIHKRMHLPQCKSWACDRCDKKFGSKNLLEEHINTHTGYRPYRCGACGKDFASKYSFKTHEKTHETRERPFVCTLCPKAFLNMNNLTQHEKTHSGIRNYVCHLCDKRFLSAHNLEVHSIVHTSYKPFVCGLCGKSFARKAEIRDHERIHTGEKPYQCEVCGATFSQRSNLQTHKRSTHFDDKRYKCEECGRYFKRKRLLDYHIKSAHTGERPYKCTICDATFVYPEHFKKHRRIHTGEKPFACEVCGKAFNSRDNRNAHRFVHSEKKPYECLQCGAGFMRKPLLYHHMQVEKHMNDTIIVNQARLPDDEEEEETYLTLVNGQLEITPTKSPRLEEDLEMIEKPDEATTETVEGTPSDAEKLFIADMIVDENDDGSKDSEQHLVLGADDDDETIIINGQRFRVKGEDDDDEMEAAEGEVETLLTTTEDFQGIITPEVIAGAQTQIIQTKDGPIQLLAVRIPNDNGEEEEAWIKILPENLIE